MNTKLFSFIISLKRFKRNSIILKKAKYKMAQQIGLHPTTFIKHLDQAIKLGFIIEKENHYKLVKFGKVLELFRKETGFYFAQYSILKKKELKFKEIVSEIEQLLLFDNIYAKQKHKIRRKQELIEVYQQLHSTVKTENFGFSYDKYKKLVKALKESNRVGNINDRLDYNREVVTSCRHASSVLGISHQKANKILNNHSTLTRSIKIMWINGVSEHIYDEAKKRFPKACIYPMITLNKTKVSFGSTLGLR